MGRLYLLSVICFLTPDTRNLFVPDTRNLTPETGYLGSFICSAATDRLC